MSGPRRGGGALPPNPELIESVPKGIINRSLVPKVDLRPKLMPVRDQGSSSQCVAYASCCMMEEWDFLNEYLSPEFIYRHRENKPEEGMYLYDAMRILMRNGVCKEKVVRTASEYTDAATRRLTGYYSVRELGALKTALADGKVVVVSLPYFDGPDDTKFWQPRGPQDGGHSVCIVGYDDATGMLTIRNSWGRGWGDKGYGYISYGDFTHYVWEAYTVDALKEGVEPPPPPEPKDDCECCVVV